MKKTSSSTPSEYFAEISELISQFNSLTAIRSRPLTPGDIVDWKPRLQNRNTKGPFIVVEVLAEPVYDTEDSSGTPYFREPLDIILGCLRTNLEDEPTLTCFHMDSRRFEPVTDVPSAAH